MAPLQKLVVRPITDPAEQEALDRRLKESEQSTSSPGGDESEPDDGPATSAILELVETLNPEQRLELVAQLAARLRPDQRVQLLEGLTVQTSR